MTTITQLSETGLLEAAHALFSASYASAWEFSGRSLPPSCRLEEFAPRLPDSVQFRILEVFQECIEAAWGHSIARVMVSGGLDPEDDDTTEDFLFELIMGVLGHGISLIDSHPAVLQAAEHKLQCSLDPAPLHLEDTYPRGDSWWDHAYKLVGLKD